MTRMDRWRNEEARRRVDVRKEIRDRVDRKVLKWFGHLEHMSRERFTKRVYEFEVARRRDRG